MYAVLAEGNEPFFIQGADGLLVVFFADAEHAVNRIRRAFVGNGNKATLIFECLR